MDQCPSAVAFLKDAPTPEAQKTAAPEIHLVLHWSEELKETMTVVK